jgi:hypothetical protein
VFSFVNKGAWWEVDLGADVRVAKVKIWNGDVPTRLSNSIVSLIDSQGMTQYSYRIGDATGKTVIEFPMSQPGLCDQLLQQFHRFDEEISIQGKWQGGSVTGVCRGWGTNKVRSMISDCTLYSLGRLGEIIEWSALMILQCCSVVSSLYPSSQCIISPTLF